MKILLSTKQVLRPTNEHGRYPNICSYPTKAKNRRLRKPEAAKLFESVVLVLEKMEVDRIPKEKMGVFFCPYAAANSYCQ
jgi:hypothetical protein